MNSKSMINVYKTCIYSYQGKQTCKVDLGAVCGSQLVKKCKRLKTVLTVEVLTFTENFVQKRTITSLAKYLEFYIFS